MDNLLAAWREFLKGKRKKRDVQEFERNLMSNIVSLHTDLVRKAYVHGGYREFRINDPKARDIHKASVRDRLLHHAVYRILYPVFDRSFIADSFSCREGKGTHKAIKRFGSFAFKISKNHTRTLWILKCDIRKFFASIDHQRLTNILEERIPNQNILWLLSVIIKSFQINGQAKGLPLGNLTSQLLVNIYMNEFDQFVKHQLKVKAYIRYADDFVLFSSDKRELEKMLVYIETFLRDNLSLTLHPKKVSIRTLASGVDFLGWVHFPDHRVLRTTSRRRMFRRLKKTAYRRDSVGSYIGLLGYGNSQKLKKEINIASEQMSKRNGLGTR